MIDNLVYFFTFNKIYFFTGVALLALHVLPTKVKIPRETRKLFYLAAIIWIVCFAYKVNTGQEIVCLLNRGGGFDNKAEPRKIEGPFKKYYSNDAGRKPKIGS